ncbi:MAG: hypothetical protein EOO99_05070 [Pedobacter sp.]|nr:MAG: hypothetical protein EOO99_05070 [Pedobacter sp.]
MKLNWTKKVACLLLFSLGFIAITNAQQTAVPKAPREFRAAWIATVANINWPSKPGLSVGEQQREAIVLLDLLKSLNFNAAILQIRPQADALYDSKIEPWSYFLTGEHGKAPEPYYDPLKFWTEAAHDRGIELHVWLNPYRAHHLSLKSVPEKSIVNTKPHLLVKLKDGQYWMDPSLKEVQDLTAAVVNDIVKRYDIDGIHFDDYFYPYESYNGGEDFPDESTWQAYLKKGGKLSRGDWRRESVNTFIKRLYKEIKAEKKEVKFGLSPFGIWRPGYPEGVEGFDQYDKLYADAKLWLNKGWVDYYTPQLYWKVNSPGQSFPMLLNWWKGENYKNRHLWPGMSIGLGGDDKNVDEVINQIMITRGITPDSKGAVHWSIAPLKQYELLRKGLIEGPYKQAALAPASPWLSKKKPANPQANLQDMGSQVQLSIAKDVKEDVFKWVVYIQYGLRWQTQILTRLETQIKIDKQIQIGNQTQELKAVKISAVNRIGNESELVNLNF